MDTSNNQTVLVLNCGSSSLKFAIINPKSGQQYLSGLAEALTLPEAQISWRFGEEGDKQKAALPAGADHTAALTFLEEEVLHGQQDLLDSLAMGDDAAALVFFILLSLSSTKNFRTLVHESWMSVTIFCLLK